MSDLLIPPAAPPPALDTVLPSYTTASPTAPAPAHSPSSRFPPPFSSSHIAHPHFHEEHSPGFPPHRPGFVTRTSPEVRRSKGLETKAAFGTGTECCTEGPRCVASRYFQSTCENECGRYDCGGGIGRMCRWPMGFLGVLSMLVVMVILVDIAVVIVTR